MDLKLIDGLSLNSEGVLINKFRENPVHLRQGDMDGACGPYCVAMSLFVLGKMDKNELMPKRIDYRTRSGKFLRELYQHDPMVLGGTEGVDLCRMLAAHNVATGEVETGTGKSLMPKIIKSLKANHPVILDVRSRKNEELAHWTLAIGFSEDYLFLLDPGYELTPSNFWNATISTIPTTTRFGYRYANEWVCFDVEISEMIEIRKRSINHGLVV